MDESIRPIPPVIKPTVGRKVWFRPGPDGAKRGIEQNDRHLPREDRQPIDATVIYVHTDRIIDVYAIDHKGSPFVKRSVQLLQADDPAPEDKDYVQWMPYQQGQAKKEAA
jgi:hypothetical protein